MTVAVIAYDTPTPDDAAALSAMAATSFAATCGSVVFAPEMAAHLGHACGADGQVTRDLADADVRWRMASEGGVGFVKVGRFDFLTGGQVQDDGIWRKAW